MAQKVKPAIRDYNRNYRDQVSGYLEGCRISPLFFCADALEVLWEIPDNSVDCCMTSPPYWGKREYSNGGIGLEKSHEMYILNLARIFAEVKRTLRPEGSFWLNVGDTYQDKRLLGIPWRLACHLTDSQGWVLRDAVVWHKVKGGPDNSVDRLRDVYEQVFHFVKIPRGYYFDTDAIRSNPGQAKVVGGKIVSATGVSGVRYKRQIELSTSLSDEEKQQAFLALDKMLSRIESGELADFRMIIRGSQRTTHSDSIRVSGRAKELRDKGFYFLSYHPAGSKPSNVWEILPEDKHRRDSHSAPYPEDLCKIPILATCPESGVVLDPFCGTGTTMMVAAKLGRKSVGIDISPDYINQARKRCPALL